MDKESPNSIRDETKDDSILQPIDQEEDLSSDISSEQISSNMQSSNEQWMKASFTSATSIDLNEKESNHDQPEIDKQSTSLQESNELEYKQPSEHILELHHAQGGFGNNFYGVISSFAIAALMNYTLTCKYGLV